MTLYRVLDSPFFMMNGGIPFPSQSFVAGQTVNIPDDVTPDSWGDYLIKGSQVSPDGYRYINQESLLLVENTVEQVEPVLIEQIKYVLSLPISQEVAVQAVRELVGGRG